MVRTAKRPTPPNDNKPIGWNASDFPYATDYNDHFETPLAAYQDVAPIIDWLSSGDGCERSRSRSEVVLYDPYYCHGRTAVLLKELGYERIVHEKRDFYQDIRNGQIPDYDVLITNPPYSENHKKRCLDFCLLRQQQQKSKPFLLLMPDYTASKEYFRQCLSAAASQQQQQTRTIVYLVPRQSYHYEHPEGTGKLSPPFKSLWFCGVPVDRVTRLRTFWGSLPGPKPALLTSLDELESKQVVSFQNRPSPRQRRKRKFGAGINDEKVHKSNDESSSKLTEESHKISSSNEKKKKSKYRDEQGKRTKKRF
jgi:hypothetical protein